MRLLHYLNYFFYIAVNWNIRLALFTVYHEIRGEKKYNLDTGKLSDPKKLSVKGTNLANAEMYQGTNYFLLEEVFSYLQKLGANQHIIDYGCGKGRVLVVAAFYGFSKITGVEFARELYEEAVINTVALQQQFPEKAFTILHADAADHQIDDDTNVVFFFNPFNEKVMLAVVKNILRALKVHPRDLYVVYVNPIHKEMFLSAGFQEIYHLRKLYYIQASILKKSPEDFEAF